MHPEHRSIGELAYRLWQARGRPEGSAEQDWLDAERQLKTETSTLAASPEQTSKAETEQTVVKTANRPRIARSKSPQPKSNGDTAV